MTREELADFVAGLREPCQMRERSMVDKERTEAADLIEQLAALREPSPEFEKWDAETRQVQAKLDAAGTPAGRWVPEKITEMMACALEDCDPPMSPELLDYYQLEWDQVLAAAPVKLDAKAKGG